MKDDNNILKYHTVHHNAADTSNNSFLFNAKYMYTHRYRITMGSSSG